MTTYLDNAATTRVSEGVRDAMLPFLDGAFGNPSSRHPLGVGARSALEEARECLARLFGAEPEGVVFTAGGTEANNLGVVGLARARVRRVRSGTPRVLVGATEHASVRASAESLVHEGFEVETLRLDASGDLDLDDLAEKLTPETVLVAVMLVNNELGTIYPIARAARLVRANAPEACLHVDGVQSVGKLPASLGSLGAHSIALSAHKIHGPKGAGALVLERGLEPRPLIHGGGQENGLRSGTENVAGAVALGVAALEADDHRESFSGKGGQAEELRGILRAGLERIEGARLLEPGAEHVSSIAAVQVPGAPGEVWMHHLETHGVYTSAGAACHSRRKHVPPGLLALGLDEESARRVLRLSFSRFTTAEDVQRACEALEAVEREIGVVG